MTIDIQEVLQRIGSHEDSSITVTKYHEELNALALDIVRANEDRKEMIIMPSSPFYNSKRNRLDHITVTQITIGSLPTLIALHDTWEQNLQPFIKGSEAREDHKKTITAMMEFIYDIDLRVTHQQNHTSDDTKELLNNNSEFMFLYNLGQKIIGNFSRLNIIVLQDRTDDTD